MVISQCPSCFPKRKLGELLVSMRLRVPLPQKGTRHKIHNFEGSGGSPRGPPDGCWTRTPLEGNLGFVNEEGGELSVAMNGKGLGEEISDVFKGGDIREVKVVLGDAVAEPIKAHVHGFRLLLFN